jgi:hypothetical protein
VACTQRLVSVDAQVEGPRCAPTPVLCSILAEVHGRAASEREVTGGGAGNPSLGPVELSRAARCRLGLRSSVRPRIPGPASAAPADLRRPHRRAAGHEPPDGTVQALRFHVSRARGVLRQGRHRQAGCASGGYQLVLAEDAGRPPLREAIAGARLARSEGATPGRSVGRSHALDLWVGPASPTSTGSRSSWANAVARRASPCGDRGLLRRRARGARHAEAVGELGVDRHHPAGAPGSF